MRDWLIQLRKSKNYTQQQVADGAHIDRAYYAQIESATRNPSMAVASQIANFLNINPSIFFSEHLSEPFIVALTNSPVVVAHCDLGLRYTWIFNPHPDFNAELIIGKRDDQINSNEAITALMDLKRKVIESGDFIRRQITFPMTTGDKVYDVFGQPIYNQDKDIIGVATVSTELQT
ncbi:helix-turn-helix domain-containing protein [Halobacillus sp. Marseille-Q1614]|uniref:helix-turn-helix domain-containing protein n=1 Tax=Halobacillus sp. Marseille-Q1614 TaxID=2709134 RepID=UPI00156DB70F|nr:helix-turn-helix domain-containing protein [Halobacillus sp. Marseille-Q1614]